MAAAMTTKYRAAVREGAGSILWADADHLDHYAEVADTYTTAEEVAAYLRELAVMYRRAASQATRGEDEYRDV